jgi:hypothetical protein
MTERMRVVPEPPLTPLKTEGWDALAEILGIFRQIQVDQSMPSVTLEMDSKGTVKPSVKVYAKDVKQAMEDAILIFDTLRERYSVTS